MYTQSELKELIDKALANLSCCTEAPRLFEPVRFILSIGGKRLRPVMSLMACNLFTDKIDSAIMPAAGLEVFHNFTLVHDDIMDQSSLRRGFPTVHQKWNLNQAILSGDVMAFIANECFLQGPQALHARVFREFNRAAIEVCEGQQLDMDYEKAALISQDEYLRMIELKTAVLLAASIKIGAIIGGAGDEDAVLIYEFGRNLGIAFQIQDDMLDIWGDSKVFGKKQGGDIVANKKNYPLVKALEIATGHHLKELQTLFTEDTLTDPGEKVRRVISVYNELNLKDHTESLAYDYINKAFGYLKRVSVTEARKKEMTDLAISLIGRSY